MRSKSAAGGGFDAARDQLARGQEHAVQGRALPREGRHGGVVGMVQRARWGVGQGLLQGLHSASHQDQLRAQLRRSRRAAARPMPLPAPVTRMRLPGQGVHGWMSLSMLAGRHHAAGDGPGEGLLRAARSVGRTLPRSIMTT